MAESCQDVDVPIKDMNLDSASCHSTSTTLSDLLDVDVDPGTLLAHITALLTTLEDTVSSLGALRQQVQEPITEKLSSACHDLFKKICELEGVVGSYVAVGGAHSHGDPIVLDPMLYKWTADCVLCLLGLQAELQEELRRGKRPKSVSGMSTAETMGTLIDEDDEKSMAETLVSINKNDDELPSLEKYLAQINSFFARIDGALPVIQADFGTYQTSHLHFPSGHPRDRRSAPAGLGGLEYGIRHLRQTLYRLKDTLSALSACIGDTLQRKGRIAFKTARCLRAMQATATHTAQTLSTYLTNDGSNWLDSLLSGSLSFSQFRGIDTRRVQAATDELATWMEQHRIMALSVFPQEYDPKYDPDKKTESIGWEISEENLFWGQMELSNLGEILKIRPLKTEMDG